VYTSFQKIETQLRGTEAYQWEQGRLQSDVHSDTVQALRVNPTLAKNVQDLYRLQETLAGVVGEIFKAKKEGRWPGEEEQRQKGVEFQQFCHRWDFLRFNSEGLLTISLAADSQHQERERVVCPYPLQRELIWETHRQAHAGASRVIRCLQMWWY